MKTCYVCNKKMHYQRIITETSRSDYYRLKCTGDTNHESTLYKVFPHYIRVDQYGRFIKALNERNI